MEKNRLEDAGGVNRADRFFTPSKDEERQDHRSPPNWVGRGRWSSQVSAEVGKVADELSIIAQCFVSFLRPVRNSSGLRRSATPRQPITNHNWGLPTDRLEIIFFTNAGPTGGSGKPSRTIRSAAAAARCAPVPTG